MPQQKGRHKRLKFKTDLKIQMTRQERDRQFQVLGSIHIFDPLCNSDSLGSRMGSVPILRLQLQFLLTP